jgi:hypothetical protein
MSSLSRTQVETSKPAEDQKVEQYLLKQKSNEKSRKNEECRMRKEKKSFGRKMTKGHAISLIRNYYCDVRE